MTNENPKTEVLKCERCEQDDASPTTEGVKTYDPRVPGEPYRTVNLCDKCKKTEPKSIFIGASRNAPPPTTPYPEPEEVPPLEGKALDDAIAEIQAGADVNKIETIKFEPITPEPIQEPIQETIVTPKSKVPKASENLAKDVETKPIGREDIESKIKSHEKDIDTLQDKRKELVEQANVLRNQINQVSGIITQKIGAVAGLRDLLGND